MESNDESLLIVNMLNLSEKISMSALLGIGIPPPNITFRFLLPAFGALSAMALTFCLTAMTAHRAHEKKNLRYLLFLQFLLSTAIIIEVITWSIYR